MKILPLRPLIAATLIAVSTPVLAKTDQAHLAYALAYEDAGELRAAVIEYKSALQRNPANLTARWRLGRLQLQGGDLDAARKELEFALQRGSQQPEAVLALAEVYLRQGDYQQVLDVAPADHGIDPLTRARTLALRGSALAGLQRFDAAREALNQAIQQHPGDVGALLGLVYLARFQQDDAAVDELLQRARATAPRSRRVWQTSADIALARGDFEQAAQAYSRLLEIDPQASVARLGLVQARLHQGRIDLANADIAALLADNPQHPEVNLAAAISAYTAHDPDTANRYLALLLTARPDHSQGLLLGAAADYDTDNSERGLQRIKTYLSMHPDNSAARRLLIALQLQAGATQIASEQLDYLLTQWPHDRQLRLLATHAALLADDPVQARGHLDTLREQHSLAPALIDPVVSALDEQRIDAAVALTQRLVLTERHAGLQGRSAAAASQLQQGQFDSALEQARALVREVPDSADLRNLLGIAELGAGNIERGREAFAQALQLAPGHPAARANLIRIDLATGQLDSARTALLAWHDAEPQSLQAMRLMSQLEQQAGQGEAATEWQRRALRVEVDADPMPAADKIRRLLAAGDSSGALQRAEALHAGSGDQPETLRVLAGALAADGQTGNALQRLEQLVVVAPDAVDHWIALSLAQQRSGDIEGAEASLQQVLDLHPGHAGATTALSRSLTARERYDEALAIVAVVTKSQPRSPLGPALEGDIQQARGDNEAAHAAYLQVLQREPSEANALRVFRFLAQSSSAELRQQATGFLEQWVAEHPRQVRAGMTLARWWSREAGGESDGEAGGESGGEAGAESGAESGRTPLAAYRALLELQPDNPIVLNELALLYQQRGELDAALALARRAHQLAADNPAIADTLGWLLLERGDQLDLSAELLASAARGLPTDAAVHYHLAVAWARQGRTEAARQHLGKVLDSGRPFAEAAAARDLLAGLSSP